ncbi:pirin family protein [Indiicoccus explosivorum]|uniref:pirin family protein n=1 Tax=Indiicoccus explosivorum TaxID=1917864 RepID=UPI000B44B863|nr:pirin-like C-terminal cupin domain-containing protein [Indiicoccus explosivorum]
MTPFKRDIKDHWRVRYNKNGYPHVQQGFIIPPDRMEEFDPFLIMAEDWFKRGTFSDHPHRGFQTITYVIDGRLEHSDNAGGYSVLDAGDVQYMNAGAGAIHAEEAVDDDLIHTLQLWLNLPKSKKNTPASYQNAYAEDAAEVEIDGGRLRVYSGDIAGVKGPIDSVVPFTMTEISLQAGAAYTHRIPADHTAFLYVLAGEIKAGESKTKLAKTDAALLTKSGTGDSEFSITADTRAKLLVYSAEPIKEEVVARGPFVMNTMEEIQEAYADFRAGKFGAPSQR